MSSQTLGALDSDLGRRRPSVTPSTRLAIAAALVVAMLAAVVGGLVIGSNTPTTASASGSTPGADASIAAELAARRDAQLAVSAFAADLNDYSVADIDGYKQRLLPLLTPGFAKSFTLAVDGIVAEVKASKMTSKGTVVQTAISSIDDERATALVVADVQVKSALGDRVRHFRWKVSLVSDATAGWLVDNFEPVA